VDPLVAFALAATCVIVPLAWLGFRPRPKTRAQRTRARRRRQFVGRARVLDARSRQRAGRGDARGATRHHKQANRFRIFAWIFED
jgi:hypothetical protein